MLKIKARNYEGKLLMLLHIGTESGYKSNNGIVEIYKIVIEIIKGETITLERVMKHEILITEEEE